MLDNGHTPEADAGAGTGWTGCGNYRYNAYTDLTVIVRIERIEKAIISIGKKDIQEMIDDGKEIEVKCHFCNTAYTF